MMIGSFQRALSSIYFDEDNSSSATIDLETVSENMSGQIRIHFEFYPNKEGLELEKGTLNTGAAASKSSNGSFDQRQGVCFLELQTVSV